MIEILTFLASNKAILVGAVGTVVEITVIVVNGIKMMRRKKQPKLMQAKSGTKMSAFLWVVNPVNLFRRVDV